MLQTRRIGLLLCMPLLAVGCQENKRVLTVLPAPATPREPTTFESPRPPVVEQPRQAAPKPVSTDLTGRTIIVDAGHGGKDPGTRGVARMPEKTIVLDIAVQLAGLLRSRGAKVVTTRASDVFIELDNRAATADQHRADLFVSVHADSAQRAAASGATIYIARNASAQSQQAGMRIEAALRRAGIESRGVERAGFRVLVGHSRPAVLVECGFLTNAADARRLESQPHRQKVAAAIADGIMSHFAR